MFLSLCLVFPFYLCFVNVGKIKLLKSLKTLKSVPQSEKVLGTLKLIEDGLYLLRLTNPHRQTLLLPNDIYSNKLVDFEGKDSFIEK